MAELELTAVPDLGKDAVYAKYIPWLLLNFYDRVCAYCLCHHLNQTVDHVVPQALDASRTHDPTNLLPACSGCNRSKGDYHPAHSARRRLPADETGYMAIDVRENLAAFFRLLPSGDLLAHDVSTADRAAWHATVLLKLDLEPWRKERQEVLKMAQAARGLLHGPVPQHEREPVLEVLIDALARRWLLLEALDAEDDAELRDAIRARRRELIASATV